ncbi:MAG: biotin--[acetyl-CoA-carboxylase] ligase [Weeksellaceae bacterium]|nr:biotin--[acetyl-CoA-carboxylase] ligase [Weeksellaceae bacterium]
MTHLFYLEKCASTNDEILQFLHSETNEVTSVYTFNQTMGRGQYGNLWKTSENENIAITTGVKESLIKTSDSIFNFYTAIVLRDFVANLTKAVVKIKWPNDLIIENKKVSGILIEKKKTDNTPFFLIGIGLNVLQEDFKTFPRAGSLLTQTGKSYDLHSLATELYLHISTNIISGLTEMEILSQYNIHLYRRSEVTVFEKDKTRQNGIIKKADEHGFLWIDLEKDGVQKFSHKEIEMLY